MIRIQRRFASVLTNLPPSPSKTQFIEQNQLHIITPSNQPLTAKSNNAFNPNYIPKNTKERLILEDLYQLLDNSKSLCNLLQDKYLNLESKQDIKDLIDQQYKLLELLKKKA